MTATTTLGHVPRGGCFGLCLADRQQASAPATIAGAITTAPIAVSGSVVAQLALRALAAAKDIWSLAIPSLDSTETGALTTTAAARPSADVSSAPPIPA